jgi:hypothetical protein
VTTARYPRRTAPPFSFAARSAIGLSRGIADAGTGEPGTATEVGLSEGLGDEEGVTDGLGDVERCEGVELADVAVAMAMGWSTALIGVSAVLVAVRIGVTVPGEMSLTT